jgi:hypothetical protein
MSFKTSSILIILSALINQTAFSQETIKSEKYTSHNKGKFYFFWGGNRENYSKSDIHFTGKNYDFTVYDAVADDKPKGWHVDYIKPGSMTIPQTNFRMGYFINDHYNISVGLDHMKYVFRQNQVANVSGYINLPTTDSGSTYNSNYSNAPINFFNNYTGNDDSIPPPFLTFEHTDGLNYINTEFSRVDDISKVFKIGNTDKFQLNITEGIGFGVLYPKTNSRVLGKERYDDFHMSGYGVSAKIGLNLTFFKYFFIQTELKAGYIDMNDIKTTKENSDKATQHFLFLQRIIAFGGIFKI